MFPNACYGNNNTNNIRLRPRLFIKNVFASEMALIKHPWTLLDIAAGNRGSTPLASSLRPAIAGATAGTPAKKSTRPNIAFNAKIHDSAFTPPRYEAGVILMTILAQLSLPLQRIWRCRNARPEPDLR
jgi:hypothetical protein